MIGLFVILLVIGGCLTLAVVALVGGMFWTGRIAVPGSQVHRLQHAKVQAEIAAFQTEAEEARLRRAQFVAQREMLEARTVEELQATHDAHFARQLESGPL